ncbi:putative dienelactone hydrolase [Sulfitobacter noctilucicola]|uniref:Putative dienelactone hydrolase n=1 Tax=Sulfitobacter noctilucicola TaxID=1342301 RepID=A0A7W6Q3F4_9RHOB|nr:alpha/beta hydrolase [Sulfitobacter noctilucicola]KIN61936.1 putative dienelactone hydrolase [Sulfitobacter noctilucicola]MBB4173543.1 putative dienelactone hydrolase [Sulfitobacter noctilucicola]
MRHTLHITALTLAISAGATFAEPAQADTMNTGITALTVTDSRTDRPLEGFLWYPTTENGRIETHHTNAVWQGIEAIEDAAPAEGKHPFVVLSHGMYGNAMNQTWLADALVDEGYIVAAISHPGTSTWSRDPDHARQMWDRPADISRVIGHALSDPSLSGLIDAERIYMAGHSLGGFTAMALAGAQYDAEGFEAFCADQPDELVCGIFANWQVGKTPEDRAAMSADLSDSRIKGFGVFDLGGTQTFSAQSLAAIERPLLVIGAPVDIAGLDLDIESRALRAALPETQVTYLEPETLSHFDFLSVCKPAAMEILAEEEPGDEIICKNGDAEREADHALIVKAVVAAFQ